MNHHVYKKIELVGTSPNSIEEAIENAVSRAAETVHNLRWFEVRAPKSMPARPGTRRSSSAIGCLAPTSRWRK